MALEDIIRDLAGVINTADDPTEQTNENLRVIILVFGNVSTLVNTIRSTDINVQVRIINALEINGDQWSLLLMLNHSTLSPQITMSAVEIVDDLQRWPEQAIVEGGPEYVIAIII